MFSLRSAPKLLRAFPLLLACGEPEKTPDELLARVQENAQAAIADVITLFEQAYVSQGNNPRREGAEDAGGYREGHFEYIDDIHGSLSFYGRDRSGRIRDTVLATLPAAAVPAGTVQVDMRATFCSGVEQCTPVEKTTVVTDAAGTKCTVDGKSLTGEPGRCMRWLRGVLQHVKSGLAVPNRY